MAEERTDTGTGWPTAVEKNPTLTCDCCGQNADVLPYHHDAHDDSGMSWDYCQICYDIGCDLRACSR